MPKLVKGRLLTNVQRQRALLMFVHRYTGQHKPQWVTSGRIGTDSPPMYATDVDWINDHAFYINKDGTLSLRSCEPHYIAELNKTEKD